ncbi:MAG: hypothetical protein ACRC78_13525 [Planktothrix sp.]
MTFYYGDMSKRGLKKEEVENLLELISDLDLEKYYKGRGLNVVVAKNPEIIKELVLNPLDIRYNVTYF